MGRTKGAVNVVPFIHRELVDTSGSSEMRHSFDETLGPLDCFLGLLKHQENFLKWVDSRHGKLKEATINVPKDRLRNSGPKNAVYNKYRLYANQLVLLEAINGFE